jgi:hypothetical protein
LYELRSDNWFDCGTGYCRGIFDPKDGVNKIVVEREPMEDEVESAGGVYLLCTPVDPDMKCQGMSTARRESDAQTPP